MVAQIRTIFNYPKLYWKKRQFVKNSEMGGEKSVLGNVLVA